MEDLRSSGSCMSRGQEPWCNGQRRLAGIDSPCSADVALKRFLPRVNPPVVVKLEVARKVLSTQLALPRSLHPVHGSLVDGKGIVVVDDNLADRAADGRFRFRLVLLLLNPWPRRSRPCGGSFGV